MAYLGHTEVFSEAVNLRFLANRIVFLLNRREYSLDSPTNQVVSQAKEFVERARRGEKASIQRSFETKLADDFRAFGAVARAVSRFPQEEKPDTAKKLKRLLNLCNDGLDKMRVGKPLDKGEFESLRLLFGALKTVAEKETTSPPDSLMVR